MSEVGRHHWEMFHFAHMKWRKIYYILLVIRSLIYGLAPALTMCFICQGCHNKIAKTWSLKKQKLFSPVFKTGIQDQCINSLVSLLGLQMGLHTCYVLTWPLFSVRPFLLSLPLLRTLAILGQGPHNIYLLKTLSLNKSHNSLLMPQINILTYKTHLLRLNSPQKS